MMKVKTMNLKLILPVKSMLLLAVFILAGLMAAAQGLKASGKKIVDENGNEVILRGMGLGGWMLQEPYMMEMSDFAGAQWEIRQKISGLIGEVNTVSFYKAWHASHCTRADIDSLASWGFNSVRLPMHYNLYTLPIEDEPVQGQNTWLEEGFTLTDSLISWCKANHMYVILDLHAAPGGQGKDKAISDYNPAKPSLWESQANRDKTIALWKKLAERYANEKWVGAYDLLNEPNWSFTTGGNQNGCSENSNAPLRQMYIQLTNAIRQVDTKHMLIIEGNCWGNNYNGVFPLWDNNMAVSFHKYWSTNDQGSIQGIMNIRNQYNVPIWLGESGENSNPWFTDAIRLVEKNGIGWAWWPMKKIGSVTNPLTIVKSDNYQTLLDYWKNGGTQPSVYFANYALIQMAENAKIQNCIYRKDVIDAMFRQISDSTAIPFKPLSVPGVVALSDFDLGPCGKAYFDTDIADYHVSTGTYTAWNNGWSYRNDAVDIEASSDNSALSNGYDIGWTADKEWLQYTVDVDSTSAYQVKLRYSAQGTGCKIRLQSDEADLCLPFTLPATGGYQSWSDYTLTDLILTKGTHKLRLLLDKGGANLGYMNFILSKLTTDVAFKAVSAETAQLTETIYVALNKPVADSTLSADGFSLSVNGDPAPISSISADPSNKQRLVISSSLSLADIDVITISYSGSVVGAMDGTPLQPFSFMAVKNNLPVYQQVPGKIEAESFSLNQGLVLETTTDAGGGQNVGYTNTGDFLEYRVRVMKTARYWFEVRVASGGSAGRIEVQQLDETNTVLNSVNLAIPVTGGWQTWKTIATTLELTKGVCTLRVKILQPEFNINWYRFSETAQGLEDTKEKVFGLYPNPAHDQVLVQVPGSAGKRKILTMRSGSGLLVGKYEIADVAVSRTLYVGNLARGLYFIEMEMGNTIYRDKLIIQ
jgi:endoglucanase